MINRCRFGDDEAVGLAEDGEDEADVVGIYTLMCRDNHTFAKFNKIGFDANGNPNRDDLHLAWMAGTRAFRLTPR